MCCLRLHYFYFNVLFVQKKLKTCCGLLLKKITCCAKREKKLNCREEKSQPPWISNGPSLSYVVTSIITPVQYTTPLHNKQ